MEKIKFTKSELKKNDLAELLVNIKNYFTNNREKLKPIIISVVFIALIALVILITFARKRNQINDIYTEALYKYSQKLYNSNEKYDEVIAELQRGYNTFSSSDMSKIMLLLTADAYYRNADYQNAIVSYDKFLNKLNDKRFKAFGQFGKALTLFQQNKLDEAATLFENIIKENSTVSAEAHIQLALIYSKQNKDNQAIELLDKFINNPQFKDTNWIDYAQYLRTVIFQKKNIGNINYNISKSNNSVNPTQSLDLNKILNTNNDTATSAVNSSPTKK